MGRGELSLDRYEIRGVLGRGGTGTVYEAYDTKTHALVALKAVDAAAAENIFRLKHEFRVLTDVQHQNLVQHGELAYEDGKWFFTMELVAGESFLDFVRPRVVPPLLAEEERSRDDVVGADTVTRSVLSVWGGIASPSRQGVVTMPVTGPSYDEVRLRSALAQLVEALSVLHASGRVHLDVKPGNVLVTHEGRLVLLDFGLVAALVSPEGSSVHHGGTPAYMAPEQIDNRPLGPPADWYALGTMLYLSLTGRLPYSGLVGMVLEEKLSRPVLPPEQLVSNLPQDLRDLCVDLLERDPEKRPDEQQIRARLGLTPRTPASRSQRRRSDSVAPPFVGRQRESEALAAALAAVQKGEARALVIEGEPGVGKTALVRHFLADTDESILVLAGRCYEQESVPFKGVDSIIDALSDHLLGCTRAELDGLFAGGVRYLATVFPVLGRVPAVRDVMAAGRRPVNEVGLRDEAFNEFARLVRALAAQKTLVVSLDDLQWVDSDSLALLERAILPGSGTPCLFVATLRTGVELPATLERMRGHAERFELGGLPEVEARALWDELRASGASAAPPAGDAERELAIREAAGHPLFLAELARSAQAGHLDRQRGTLLVDVLRERIRHLDELEQRFLEMAAVAGAPTPYDVVANAAQLEVGACLNRLGSLKAAQLLVVTLVDGQRCVEPYHDRIREALIGVLERQPEGLAPLQLRLGRALLAATPPAALPARVFTIVRHLNAAHALLGSREERLKVAELDLLASREARLATAYERARDHAHAGLEIIAELGWSGAYGQSKDLHSALMEAEAMAGQRERARAVFETSRRRMASAEDSAALWATWVAVETDRGHFEQAIAAGREALRELGRPIPERITRATVLRQFLANRWAQRGRTAAELVDLPAMQDAPLRAALDILVALGPPAFFVDTQLLAWLNLRVGYESMRHGVCDVSAFGFAGYGKVEAGTFAQYRRADELGQAALALGERLPNVETAAKVTLQLGAFIDSWVRPYAAARKRLREAHELARHHGDRAYEVYAATIYSIVTFCESTRLDLVQEAGEWAHGVGMRRKNLDMAYVPEAHARYAAALRGPAAPGARVDLGRPGSSDADFRARLDPKTTPAAMFHYHFCNAELAWLSDDLARAASLLQIAAHHVGEIYAFPTTAELALLEALVAARRLDHAGPVERAKLYTRLFARARRLSTCARSMPQNFAAAALLVRGELARVSGRAAAATRLFEEATAAARAHGQAKREAWALELAARLAQTRGDARRADRLRSEAAEAYRRWGARWKAERLV